MFKGVLKIRDKLVSRYVEPVSLNKSMFKDSKVRVITQHFVFDMKVPDDMTSEDMQLTTVDVLRGSNILCSLDARVEIDKHRVSFDTYVYDTDKSVVCGVKFNKVDMYLLLSFWDSMYTAKEPVTNK